MCQGVCILDEKLGRTPYWAVTVLASPKFNFKVHDMSYFINFYPSSVTIQFILLNNK